MDNQPHGLQTGQSVVFREVNGMIELNSTVRQVSGIFSADHGFSTFHRAFTGSNIMKRCCG